MGGTTPFHPDSIEVVASLLRMTSCDNHPVQHNRPDAIPALAKGAEFATEPFDLRPGLKIAFVRAPGDVRIELLERS